MPRLPVRLAALSAALAVTASAPAIDLGLGLFKKKPNPPAAQPPKNDPAARLKQLLATLQSDPDVDRRRAAAEELKAADPRGVDVLPALVGAIQKDPSPAVRTAVAEALGGMKAPPATTGAALEAVEKGDPDAGVRAAAKAALWQLQSNAARTTQGPAAGSSKEPPFARPPATVRAPVPTAAPAPAEQTFRPITQGPGKAGVLRETSEPPFARPKPGPAPQPVAVPVPAIEAPPLPSPAPVAVPAPNPPARPAELPSLSIPTAPPVIVAPPPGNGGLPTIVPPGSGK